MDGIAFAKVASLSIEPRIVLTKSMPSSIYRRAASSASSKDSPPGRSSSIIMRIPTTKSGPTAERIARITRRGKAMRRARLPPNSSFR